MTEADNEIDVAVAKLCGCYEETTDEEEAVPLYYLRVPEGLGVDQVNLIEGACWLSCPEYSTDLNLAFAAAEKMAKNGFAVHWPREAERDGTEARCIVGKPGIENGAGQIDVRADTPALAICKALIALGEI